jgi:hypothetical protein
MCTYAGFHMMWNTYGVNRFFIIGDAIGDVAGDDQVLCVNNTTNPANFEGVCNKAESHDYRCCMGGGR